MEIRTFNIGVHSKNNQEFLADKTEGQMFRPQVLEGTMLDNLTSRCCQFYM